MRNLIRNVKGSTFWKRVLAGVLTMVMLLTLIPASVSDVIAANDFEITAFTGYIKRGDTTIPLADAEEVYEGDVVKINCAWKLSNLSSTTAPQTFTVDLKQYLGNIKLDSQSGQPVTNASGTQVGEVSIDANGIATYTITDSDFLQESERSGTSTYDGTITVANSKENNGKQVPFKAGSGSAIQIKYYAERNESSLDIAKWREGNAVKSGDTLTQKFKVKVSANGGIVSGITLTDTPGSGLSDLSNIKITAIGGSDISLSVGNTYTSLADLNTALQQVILAKDEYIELEYTMKVDLSIYDAENTQVEAYGNGVTAEYKNNRDTEKITEKKKAYANVTPPQIEKRGMSYDPDTGLITWKITIKLNDFLEDFMNSGKTIEEYITNITDTPGAGQDSLATLKTSITSTGTEGVYYVEYTTKAKAELREAIKAGGYVFNNTISAKVGNKTISTSGTYTYSPEASWISKTWKSYDASTKELTWEVSVDIPDQTVVPITNVKLSDMSGDTGKHTINKAVKYNGKTIIDASGNITTDGADIVSAFENTWNGTAITLKDSFVTANSGNKVTFTYVSTIVADDWTRNTEFINHAKLQYRNTNLNQDQEQSASAIWKDTTKVENAISKSGTVSSTKDEITYTVKVNLDAIASIEAGKVITLTDVYPEDMQLDTSSIHADMVKVIHQSYGDQEATWDGTEAVAVTTDTSINGTLKMSFTVTQSMVDLITNGAAAEPKYGSLVRITYTAAIADEQSFINSGTKKVITNTVTGKYNGSLDIGTATVSNDITPKSIVSKTGEYTEDSAPDVSYSVDINPNALNLVDGDTLTATDSIGSALDFNLNSIKLEKITAGGTVILTKGTDYDYTLSADKRTLTLTIPDSAHLKLTYKAKVNATIKVYPLGSTHHNDSLTPENSYNRFEISGYTSTQTKSEKSFAQVAYTPKHQTVSELRDITIAKYWTDSSGTRVALNGSTFQLRYASYDTVTGKMVDGDIIKDEITISAADGKVLIENLPIDRIFVLYEKSSKSGFAIRRDPYYFVLTGSEGVTLPTGIDIKTFSEEQNVLEYENYEEGKLKISKSIVNANWNEIKNRITFTVKKGQTVLETFTGNDMVPDGDVYSKTLEQLEPASDYTVTETVQTVAGKTLQSVTYKIGTQSETSGNQAPNITIQKNQTQTVLFTNTYTAVAESGSLRLIKDVTGDLAWDAVKDSISFTIKQVGASVETTYTAADFTRNAETGKYECVVDNLPIGMYEVTETAADITGYKRVTKYSIMSDTSGMSSGMTAHGVQITNASETRVTFENQYTKQTGSLILKKRVTGDLAWENVKDLLSFEVRKDGSAEGVVYTGNDFTYDAATETAQLVLPKLPIGTYTVTERMTDKAGYVVTTTYTIDSGAVSEGNKATVEIEDGAARTVAYENSYSDNAGILKLSKSLSGTVPAEAVQNRTVFRIQKQGETTYKDYALSEFILNVDTGRYELTISLAPGTYTIEERTREVNGYRLISTVYTVEAGAETEGTTATFEIVKGGTVKVDYINTYSKNTNNKDVAEAENTEASTTVSAEPKTGDNTPIQTVLILGLAACMGAGALFAEHKRRQARK